MYEDVPLAYINIHKGGVYSESWNLADELGDPLTSNLGWAARAQIKETYDSDAIVTFGVGGEGTAIFDSEGNVTLNLSATATAALPVASYGSNGRPDGRIYLGDIEVWQNTAPTVKWHALDLRVRIYPEVTTA